MEQFYNDLDGSLDAAQRLIIAGAVNRKSAAHTPVVATINAQGQPAQRVMILRHVDWASRTLRFHTDARAAKVNEAHKAPTSVLFYDPDVKIQLRLSGQSRIERDGTLADAAWNEATLFARRCYLAECAPGGVSDSPTSGLRAALEGQQPTATEIMPARENFALLLIQFDSVEWLYLANQGHRRARWLWTEEQWQGCWLIP
jgi:pyridoxamine 5'-phosphate oxidase